MKNKYFLLLVLIPLILVVIWFRSGNIMGGGESALPFYDLSRYLEISKFSWSDLNLGNQLGIGVAGEPTYWFLDGLEKLSIPNFIIQAGLFGLILIIAGISVHQLVKELFPNFKNQYALLVVSFYWFNPISLVIIWNRFLYNHMFFWALLPLALFLFLKGLKQTDYRFAILTSLSTVVFSFALTSTAFNILLWGLLFYTATLFLFFEKGARGFIAKYFLLTLASFVLFHFWWLGQLASFVFSPAFKTATAEFFSPIGNLSTLTSLSQRLGNIVDTTRLMHGSFFTEPAVSWAGVFDFGPVVLLEFAVAAVLFWTIYRFRKLKPVLFLGVLFILSLFLVKGNNPPFGEIFQFVFVKVPFLQVFRNPFEKFGFLLPLASAPLFAFGLEQLVRGLKSPKAKRALVFGAFVFVIGLWGFPFWTGLVFTSTEGRGGKLRSYEVKVPAYYREANKWLKEQGDDFRFISLPLGGEGITYTWEKPYSGVELSSALFETPNISFNTTIPFYNELVSELSRYQMNEKILNFLPFINGKYVLWRGDVDFKERGMADPTRAYEKIEGWASKGLLSKQFEAGKLKVYEVVPQLTWPKIYVTPLIILSNERDLINLTNFISDFPTTRMAAVDLRFLPKSYQLSGQWIIKPEKVFLPQVTAELHGFTDEDLLARLFYVKHLPDNWFYFLIRWKEVLQTPPRSDYAGWVLYKTGILGKRAVEVYKLKTGEARESIIAQAEKDYLKNLQELTPLFEILKSDSPVSNVVRESLLYQWLLLDRVHSESATVLSDLLLELKIKPKFALPISEEGLYLVYHFDLPKEGKYQFVFDKPIKGFGWFLNSQPIKVFFEKGGLKTDEIDLMGEVNEFALLASEFEILSPILEEEKIIFNDKTTPQWNIELPNIPVTHNVSFDFRFKRGKAFNLQFKQDIDRENLPVFSTQVVKDEFFHEWKHWTGEFTPSIGAAQGVLKIFPGEQEICVREWWGGKRCQKEKSEFEVEIRDFRVRKVEHPNSFLVSGGDLRKATDTVVTYTKLNPTLYKVEVKKPTPGPEILVFSELFNSGWEARFEDETKILEDKHFLVNAYANGWLIEKTGDYTLTLEFAPQELLEVGGRISDLSVLGALVFLGIVTVKRRRSDPDN